MAEESQSGEFKPMSGEKSMPEDVVKKLRAQAELHASKMADDAARITGENKIVTTKSGEQDVSKIVGTPAYIRAKNLESEAIRAQEISRQAEIASHTSLKDQNDALLESNINAASATRPGMRPPEAGVNTTPKTDQ